MRVAKTVPDGTMMSMAAITVMAVPVTNRSQRRWAHEINPVSASQFRDTPAFARQKMNRTLPATYRFRVVSVIV